MPRRFETLEEDAAVGVIGIHVPYFLQFYPQCSIWYTSSVLSVTANVKIP